MAFVSCYLLVKLSGCNFLQYMSKRIHFENVGGNVLYRKIPPQHLEIVEDSENTLYGVRSAKVQIHPPNLSIVLTK